MKKIRLLFLRHGMTQGNLEKRYIGATDEPLLPESAEKLRENRSALLSEAGAFCGCDDLRDELIKVYISPMLRCRETAQILFPDAEKIIVKDFRECSFGTFEYRNYEELKEEPEYLHFLASGGESGFPGGETKADFSARVLRAFEKLTFHEMPSLNVLVVHGGTIMALLEHYAVPHGDYYSFRIPCGNGFFGDFDGEHITGLKRWAFSKNLQNEDSGRTVQAVSGEDV